MRFTTMPACVVVAAVVLAAITSLGGCTSEQAGTAGGSATTPIGESLQEYAKRSCAAAPDMENRLRALQTEAQQNIGYPSALADTFGKLSQTYRDLAKTTEELGDPPNGEAAGESKEEAGLWRALADKVDAVAIRMRAATTPAEIETSVHDFQSAFADVTAYVAQAETKYPTPELDKLTNAIPGCEKKHHP